MTTMYVTYAGDDAAIEIAFASPETLRVMVDVACSTDAKPAQSLAGPI